ncbi:hypothetical protein Bca52824_094349 [Brassica carinata]|uniref:Uncharacterized protein n=1 Tax=Brassica carinata TaxID=52824 RepID=A0A8X7TJB2_BRACI|nr:hypothetical protein Bca52824_094349 [Brassica carinata]
MSNSDEEETIAIAHLQSILQRRRPLHSKRRASRDSAAKGKKNSTWDDQEMNTEDAGSAKKMEEVMILKKAAAKMGVKQMSSTAYLSEPEEEAMIMGPRAIYSFPEGILKAAGVENLLIWCGGLPGIQGCCQR